MKTSALAEEIDLTAGQIAGQITAHAAVGGVTSVAGGGKFGHGFIAAGFAKGIGTPIYDITGGNATAGFVATIVIGGTTSEISGGKFANGARTAAYQFLFNQMGNNKSSMRKSLYATYERVSAMILNANDLTIPKEKICYSTCIDERYGWTREVADTLSPASALSLIKDSFINSLSAELVDHSRATAIRNLYGGHYEFHTGTRQMQTLNLFNKFNVGMALVGAGAAGYQFGSFLYCAQECI